MSVLCRKSILFLILAWAPVLGWSFAGNNVRRDRFKWMQVQTEHFDIYYDEKTARMVPRMAHYLESAWKDVGDTYNYHVPERTPFFFFSNHNLFEETNIVSIGEGTGGVTEAFKNRFLVFNDGSEEWLRHVVYHEFAHVVQFNVIYSGFWKSIRVLAKSPFLPLWMMEGCAEFGAGDIDDANGDMVVRDAYFHNQLPDLAELHGFSHLKPNQITLGYKTGDAAIEFLKDEYGAEKPGQLLIALRDYFEASSVLDSIIGSDLPRFNNRFREWLGEKYRTLYKTGNAASFYGFPITKGRDEIPNFNEAPVLSKDGKTIYHFSDRGGPFQLCATDIATRETKALLPLNYIRYENLHTGGRALSMSADGRWLAFAGEKTQRDFLYLFDLQKKKLRRVKVPFDEIRSPVFSPIDNDKLVCIGMDNGYNDIYVIDRHAKVLERLTNNPQDERDVVFSPDGEKVYFSGEVMSEDLSEPLFRNLYSITLENKFVKELTQTIGTESAPEPIGNDKLVYVRDRDDQGNYGFNLVTMDLTTGKEDRLTNFIGGGFSPRYDAVGDRLFFIGFNAGEKHIYQATWTFQNVLPTSIAATETSLEDSIDGGPRKRQARAPALLQWPYSVDSPLFLGNAKTYRFKASTDLFIPFLFYSTLDGLVLVDIWQVSDMLGDHQFQQQAQYASGSDTVDLSMLYTYAHFRPTLSFGVRGLQYYRDVEKDEQRREITGISYMTYPLDRVQSVSFGAGATARKDTFRQTGLDTQRFEDRFLTASYDFDTVTGHYLVPTKGGRLSLFFQKGFNSFGGDQRYNTGGFDGSIYVPLPRESTWASRLFFGRSTGRNAQVFRLGGIDRIRALSSGALTNKKTNVTLASTELRLRIKYLNARTKFLFPDFFFKAAYLILFNDMGYGWDNEQEREQFKGSKLENSAGVGVSWPTFILQTFQLNLTVQWAHRTNTGSDIWYITAGPSF